MKDSAAEALEVAARIRPLLAGLGPEVQGAVLADLVSLYFAGHAPQVRFDVIAKWLTCVDELIPASEEEIASQIGFNPWELK